MEPLTADTITDEQIRDLQRQVLQSPAWGGGGKTRELMLKHCAKALESRIYRGALARICDAINDRNTKLAEVIVECPTCGVQPGIRCASLRHSGYKALKRSHHARFVAFNARAGQR